MGSHDPFEHLKHKLWPKKRSGVKLAIWLSTTKSQESPWFPRVQVECNIPLKYFRRGLQLCFKPHLNWRPVWKVMKLQSCGSLNPDNFGTSIGSPRTKCHLDVGFVEKHIIYYKGENDGFAQVRVVVSLVSSRLPMVCPSTKSVQIMH
jgi:hypothetical protein